MPSITKYGDKVVQVKRQTRPLPKEQMKEAHPYTKLFKRKLMLEENKLIENKGKLRCSGRMGSSCSAVAPAMLHAMTCVIKEPVYKFE